MLTGLVKVNSEICVACSRCVQACALEHSQSKSMFEAIAEDPPPRPRVKLHEVGGSCVPTECRHCEAAACALVCPTGAMVKMGLGGPVVVDDKLCIGCRSCVLTCPYGVPEAYLQGEQITKCDLCIDRLREDRIPACAESCPTGALEFAPSADPEKPREFTPWRNL